MSKSGISEQVRRLLPGLWAGLLLCIALIATPAPFATLERAQAGRVVAHVFAHEAPLSLAVGVLLAWLERRRAARRAEAGLGSQFSLGMALALGAVACTVAGYYALQPMMEAARSGAPGPSFGTLHAASLGLFGLKIVCAVALAWRAATRPE